MSDPKADAYEFLRGVGKGDPEKDAPSGGHRSGDPVNRRRGEDRRSREASSITGISISEYLRIAGSLRVSARRRGAYRRTGSRVIAPQYHRSMPEISRRSPIPAIRPPFKKVLGESVELIFGTFTSRFPFFHVGTHQHRSSRRTFP
jgi:hypothetical protein